MKCFCGGNKNSGKLIAKLYKNFEIRECASCGQLFSYPPPVLNTNKTRVYQFREVLSDKRTSMNFNYARLNLSFINNFGLKNKKLLDFGCGTGETLILAQKSGMNCYGVEINKYLRKDLRSKGFDVRRKLSDFNNTKFDFVLIIAVLEHLPAEEDILEELKNYLKTDSKVLIHVPNYESFARRLFGKYWSGYQPSQHLWYFTPKSLYYLLKSKEYNVEELVLHSLGKGIDNKSKYVYDSAGYFLSSTNIFFRFLNFILHRMDFLLSNRLGKFIRQYKEKEFGDGIYALITLNSKNR